MKIEIDGWRDRKILTNDKNYTKKDVEDMYNNTLLLTTRENIIKKMAQLYSFEIINFSFDEKCDYCIDTDIDEIYYINY